MKPSVLDMFDWAQSIRMPAQWTEELKSRLRQTGIQDFPDETGSTARIVGLPDTDYAAEAAKALNENCVMSILAAGPRDAETRLVEQRTGSSIRLALVDPERGDVAVSLREAARYDVDILVIGAVQSPDRRGIVDHWAARYANAGSLVARVSFDRQN